MRVGSGIDVHRFSLDGGVRLLGVLVDADRGIEATSDGDVAAHAVVDALLGAAGLGDIGTHYPSSSADSRDADSMGMLAEVVDLVADAGYAVSSVDVTIVVEKIRVAPFRDEMRLAAAAVLRIPPTAVSVKATTTDGLGLTGRDEGLAVFAVAVLSQEG